jgi:peptidoglycan/xylan/chitin deacetylase (PgdA/CDA1 family)
VVIQPNQQRRTRVFRATAGVVVLLAVSSLLATGLVRPPALSFASATPSPTVAATLTVAPTPSGLTPPTARPTAPPASPTPSSTTGCAPPPADLAPAVAAFHGPRTTKVIALTFDDGFNPSNVLRILRVLKRKHVNATFFPTGRAVELYPVTWGRVAKAGFPIANHTYAHVALAGLCYDRQLAELQRAQAALVAAGITPQPLMRPPFEAFDATTLLAASTIGETHVVLWDVDTGDWTGAGAATIARRALSGRSGSIVLLHTTSGNTTAALAKIIRRYRERGYTFVTIGTLLGVPGPVPFP